MVETGPLAGALLSLLGGILYVWVGRVILARPVAGPDRVANLFFVMWWWALGGITLAGGIFGGAAAFGYTDLALHLVLTHVAILFLCAALWGLAYFLIYLYTGRTTSLIPLGVFYAVLYIFLDYVIVHQDPIAVTVGAYQTRLVFANDLGDQDWLGRVLLLFLAPQLLAAIAYFSLFFKVREPMLRYRVAMVSGSFIIWFGTSILASLSDLNEVEWWGLVSRAIGVMAALAVLLAYRPPSWLRRQIESPQAAPGGAP